MKNTITYILQGKENTTNRYPYSDSIFFFGHKPLFIFPKFQLLAYIMKCACCGGEMISDEVSEKTIVYKMQTMRLKRWIKGDYPNPKGFC
jgi:hypothetical protein